MAMDTTSLGEVAWSLINASERHLAGEGTLVELRAAIDQARTALAELADPDAYCSAECERGDLG